MAELRFLKVECACCYKIFIADKVIDHMHEENMLKEGEDNTPVQVCDACYKIIIAHQDNLK